MIVALGPSQQLQRAVGDDLVGIHVGRCAGAALDDVDHEFLVQPAGPDFLGGGDDGIGARGIEQPKLAVALRRGELDRRQRRNEIGIDRDLRAADREILDRAQRVDAIIGIRRNIPVAQQIMFESRVHGGLSSCVRGVLIRSGRDGFSKP